MSHIQKILERAERDGTIRPSSPFTTEPPRGIVTTLNPSDGVFPIPPVSPTDTPSPVFAPRPVTTTHVAAEVFEAVRPGTLSSDQFRTLRTRIQHAARGRAVNALAVTSPGAGEGRTHTAASLALSMTREFDRRVCVVDAHLRGPRLRDIFGLPDGPGLVDVLTERARLEDALVHIEELALTVLPGGDATAQPELLGSVAMRRIMQALRAQFDRLVIDAPPAVPVADVALLTPLVDGLLLVVRAGSTPKPMIHEAISGINSDKLLGVVLNDRR